MRYPDRRDFLKTAGSGAAAMLFSGGMNFSCSAVKTKKSRPNILYLMSDQHRFDFIGCSGNNVIKTPNIDRIAGEGVRFSCAYSSTPTCTPARSALLTGLSPWNHGMLGYGRVPEHFPFELPQAVRDAGYYTFGIGKMHWFPQKTLHGFHRTLVDESGRVESPDFISDYRSWFKKQAPGLDPDATGVGWNDYYSRKYVLPEELHPTYWTGQTAADYIKNYDRAEPFLLKVSFARPHSPYDPPERFMKMYDRDSMPEPFTGNWAERYREHDDPPKSSLWHGDLGAEQAKKSRQGYAGSISFIDEQIGRIFKVLEERDMWDNTLIVFLTDHGDMLGDHHLWRKSYAYEGSAHIPMLMKWPGGEKTAVNRGSVISDPVELRDVLPTFLDAAGADIPNHLDGKSLLSLVRGGNNNWRDYIDLEHSRCYSKSNHWNALTDGNYKYIFHALDGSEQLFNLAEDPGELVDLSKNEDKKSTLIEWRARMTEHLIERGEEYVLGGKLIFPRKNILYSPHFPKQKTIK